MFSSGTCFLVAAVLLPPTDQLLPLLCDLWDKKNRLSSFPLNEGQQLFSTDFCSSG